MRGSIYSVLRNAIKAALSAYELCAGEPEMS
jgi:hypothetical protein